MEASAVLQVNGFTVQYFLVGTEDLIRRTMSSVPPDAVSWAIVLGELA
jgi:hypothetical protein